MIPGRKGGFSAADTSGLPPSGRHALWPHILDAKKVADRKLRTLSWIARSCGVSWDPKLANFVVMPRCAHHRTNNQTKGIAMSRRFWMLGIFVLGCAASVMAQSPGPPGRGDSQMRRMTPAVGAARTTTIAVAPSTKSPRSRRHSREIQGSVQEGQAGPAAAKRPAKRSGKPTARFLPKGWAYRPRSSMRSWTNTDPKGRTPVAAVPRGATAMNGAVSPAPDAKIEMDRQVAPVTSAPVTSAAVSPAATADPRVRRRTTRSGSSSMQWNSMPTRMASSIATSS